MNITQIMLSKGFGGAERYFVDLSLELAAKGHTIQAICHRDFIGIEKLKVNNNIKINTVSFFGTWDPIGRSKACRHLDAFKPDIVHAHLARATHWAGKCCKAKNIPLVTKTHNYVNLKYYRGVDHFITTTQDQRNYLINNNIPEQSITVIPNFSRLKPIKATASSLKSPPIFLTYGRMVTKKGFHILIQAFKSYIEKTSSGRLIIGGDGPMKPELRSMVSSLDLDDHIEMPGWLDNPALLLQQADIFILPSLDEPFGIAVLEAMAMGTPIISTRTKGPLEILSKESAYLVDIEDAAGLTKAMITMTTNPEHSLQLANQALARFNNLYSSKAVIPKILECYNLAIQQKHSTN